MSNILTYDPSQVSVVINGWKCSALESITVTQGVSPFHVIKGINGINTRVRNLDTSANIVLVVKQTAITNDVLSYIHENDVKLGTGGFNITIKDNGGTSFFTSDDASIVSLPPIVFNNVLSPRTWHISCGSSSIFHVGSNFVPTTSLF